MVVDDDPLIAMSMEAIIGVHGYSVVVCDNGADALYAYIEAPQDLVITDARMPKLGGVELTRELLKRNPLLPVIIISGYSDIVADKGWEKVIILQKPVDGRKLMTSIGKLLSVP
ncbi:response regulator [Azospirillum sp. SYSU D00513]|uniref:response regulator n=1 Tax=Azospirillum sp. SYSU D00513 TaxID=2812561 RepID=UPI001A970F9A|nr:response regulator [Azospirillum sp. SYSU D00513]